ncbi:unnamed protein product [Brassica rapa]|uniref:Uncharacterized protein n=1 Tax=Brassica campestris TaxID=3711 RepID=A0A8D9GB26_BRACM|nr:unnamed protein product [Brassica rapa]
MEKCVLCFILFLAIFIVAQVEGNTSICDIKFFYKYLFNLSFLFCGYKTTEVEAVNKLACRFTDRWYKGKCGNNGNSICTREVKEFIAKHPDVSKSVLGEMRCNCTDIPVKANEEIRRECSCRYDCNFH